MTDVLRPFRFVRFAPIFVRDTPRVADMQQIILIVLIVAAALATLGMLARGLIVMSRGKDITGVQSNRLMSYRIGFQALAIVFIVILFLINRH